jgi:hypothetical protein
MDRRTFCLGSAAAAVCCQADRAFAAANPGAAIALDYVLFDSRYAECRLFAAAAIRSGHETVAFEGDITSLWYDALRPQWAGGGGAIAGMSTPSSLFCLEQLAKDHWRRVLIRIEHRPSGAGNPSHRVTASEPMLTRTCAALDRHQAWTPQVMSLLAACERAKDRARVTRVVPGADAGSLAAAATDLVSWVIAA